MQTGWAQLVGGVPSPRELLQDQQATSSAASAAATSPWVRPDTQHSTTTTTTAAAALGRTLTHTAASISFAPTLPSSSSSSETRSRPMLALHRLSIANLEPVREEPSYLFRDADHDHDPENDQRMGGSSGAAHPVRSASPSSPALQPAAAAAAAVRRPLSASSSSSAAAPRPAVAGSSRPLSASSATSVAAPRPATAGSSSSSRPTSAERGGEWSATAGHSRPTSADQRAGEERYRNQADEVNNLVDRLHVAEGLRGAGADTGGGRSSGRPGSSVGSWGEGRGARSASGWVEGRRLPPETVEDEGDRGASVAGRGRPPGGGAGSRSVRIHERTVTSGQHEALSDRVTSGEVQLQPGARVCGGVMGGR